MKKIINRKIRIGVVGCGRISKNHFDSIEKHQEKIEDYTVKFAHPYHAAARGYIDEVIFPRETRHRLIRTFEMLKNKMAELPRKKHGNIPL